jgi:hypothetical protein
MNWVVEAKLFPGCCCESGFCRCGLGQGAAPKMPGCACSPPHFCRIWGFCRRVRRGGFSIRCSRKKRGGGVFTSVSGGARHAHLRRSSVGLVAHGLWLFRTARTAFLKTFLCVVLGVRSDVSGVAFSGVGMGVSDWGDRMK